MIEIFAGGVVVLVVAAVWMVDRLEDRAAARRASDQRARFDAMFIEPRPAWTRDIREGVDDWF